MYIIASHVTNRNNTLMSGEVTKSVKTVLQTSTLTVLIRMCSYFTPNLDVNNTENFTDQTMQKTVFEQ